MQLNQLKPIHKGKAKTRFGRGGKHGFYCGKGAKGQTSRAGKKFKPLIRQIIKRYPKLRGYKFKAEAKPVILNISILEKNFNAGDIIDLKLLLSKKLINRVKGRMPDVKILGKEKLTKAFTIKDCLVSNSVKESMEKAGGKVI